MSDLQADFQEIKDLLAQAADKAEALATELRGGNIRMEGYRLFQTMHISLRTLNRKANGKRPVFEYPDAPTGKGFELSEATQGPITQAEPEAEQEPEFAPTVLASNRGKAKKQ